jgi:hypothetical protein
MSDIAICAICGKEKELCGSIRIDGIQQPRICKKCLLENMSLDEWPINNTYWILQMKELGDQESLKALGV